MAGEAGEAGEAADPAEGTDPPGRSSGPEPLTRFAAFPVCFQCRSSCRSASGLLSGAFCPAWLRLFSPWQPPQVRISPACIVTQTRSRTIASPLASVVCQVSARLAGTNAAVEPSAAILTLPAGPEALPGLAGTAIGFAMTRRPVSIS